MEQTFLVILTPAAPHGCISSAAVEVQDFSDLTGVHPAAFPTLPIARCSLIF